MSKHSISVQWSETDKGYIATVPELPDLSAFGTTEEEAVKELLIVKKAYLEVLKEDGEAIPEPDFLVPFSGQTRLRLPKSLHQSLASEAKREGVSLNTYIVQLLSERHADKRVEERLVSIENMLYTQRLEQAPTVTFQNIPEGTYIINISESNRWAYEASEQNYNHSL